jgi:hypothetical protein
MQVDQISTSLKRAQRSFDDKIQKYNSIQQRKMQYGRTEEFR